MVSGLLDRLRDAARAALSGRPAGLRVLFVANAAIPTLQLSFLVPLEPLVRSGELRAEILTEERMKERFGKRVRSAEAGDWAAGQIRSLAPRLVVFCRYSGPHVEAMIAAARSAGAAVVFHVDDDLLNVPREIGAKKFEFHNDPARKATVRHLLERSDLVYCSTERLRQRFEQAGFTGRMVAGRVYCAADVMRPAVARPARKLGYMGFDHAQDFELALPALVEVMRRHPHLTFDLFGPIPKPAALDAFGDRVTIVEAVRDYDAFMKKLASLEWDIGICPLVRSRFNEVKANTKWVEYTAAGAAVVASQGTVYDACCADSCGWLAASDGEWLEALSTLVEDDARRHAMTQAAQRRLEREFSSSQLRQQVLSVLRQAMETTDG